MLIEFVTWPLKVIVGDSCSSLAERTLKGGGRCMPKKKSLNLFGNDVYMASKFYSAHESNAATIH